MRDSVIGRSRAARTAAGSAARRILMTVSSAAYVFLAGAPVVSQEEILIAEPESLPCTIQFEEGSVYRGKGIDDLNWIGDIGAIELLPDGRVAVSEPIFSPRFLVAEPFGGDARWVGRKGKGPNEYSFIRAIRTFADQLHVFDGMSMRRTALDSDLNVLRTTQINGWTSMWDALVVNDTLFVLNGAMHTPERAGYAMHLVNDRGEFVYSFDEMEQWGVPGRNSNPERNLSQSIKGRFWSSPEYAYRLDQWDAKNRQRLRTVVRDAPWFPSHDGGSELTPDRPKPPTIRSLWEDPRGRVWVSMYVSSDQWAECLERPGPNAKFEGEPPQWVQKEDCKSRDKLIEVVDVERQEVVAKHVDWGPLLVGGGEYVVTSERDIFEFPILRTWKPTAP